MAGGEAATRDSATRGVPSEEQVRRYVDDGYLVVPDLVEISKTEPQVSDARDAPAFRPDQREVDAPIGELVGRDSEEAGRCAGTEVNRNVLARSVAADDAPLDLDDLDAIELADVGYADFDRVAHRNSTFVIGEG